VSLVANRRDLFELFQRTHNPRPEAAMRKASIVVSFVGHEAGRAVFVGVYRITDSRLISQEEFWNVPGQRELARLVDVGVPVSSMVGSRSSCLLFDLQEENVCDQYRGRLIVAWPGEKSWYRWANRNKFLIDELRNESYFHLDEPVNS
jgi:hypothetical protein